MKGILYMRCSEMERSRVVLAFHDAGFRGGHDDVEDHLVFQRQPQIITLAGKCADF